MATDTELRDQAVAHLKRTSIAYPEWERRKQQGKYADVTVTEWWRAFDALGKIGVVPPVVTPPPPPTVDPPPSVLKPMTVAQFNEAVRNGGKVSNAKVDGGVVIDKAGVALGNVELPYINVTPNADGLTLIGVRSGGLYWQGAQDGIIDENCVFDGGNNSDKATIWDADQDHNFKVPSLTIRRSTFKNFRTSNPSDHTQALFLGPSKGVLELCVFENNGNTSHVFLNEFGFAVYRGKQPFTPEWTIRGCTFGDTAGAYFSVNVHPDEIPFQAAQKIFVEPGQRSVKPLCSDPRWVRVAP